MRTILMIAALSFAPSAFAYDTSPSSAEKRDNATDSADVSGPAEVKDREYNLFEWLERQIEPSQFDPKRRNDGGGDGGGGGGGAGGHG